LQQDKINDNLVNKFNFDNTEGAQKISKLPDCPAIWEDSKHVPD
jgi:hypothetical protein